MSSIKDKNLLFYSIHPKDEYSKQFLSELDKNPILKKQFILVCVNDPNIRIPDKIKQLNKVPVLVVTGFNQPIFGQDAVSWLKNNSFQEKANGFEYGSLGDDTSKYAFLGDEMKTSDYNQFFNSDYNHGFTEKESTINQQFTNLKTDAHITTFDDASEMKKDIQSQLEQRLNQLRQQRDSDVPKPIKRIGGFDGTGGNTPSLQDTNTTAPTYNPNPFAGSHNQQALPFSMPPPPSRRSAGESYPLPFYMQSQTQPGCGSLPFSMNPRKPTPNNL